MHRTLGPLVALLAACVPPPDLDDDRDAEGELLALTDALPLIFTDFEQGCERLAFLTASIEAGLERQGIDPAGDKGQRVFAVEPLQHGGLPTSDAEEPWFYGPLDVTVPEGTSPDDQTPVVAFGVSVHDFDTNVEVALEPNQVCIESDSTVFYKRTWTEGADCVATGDCEVARSTNEVRKELSIIASGWYDLYKDFRHCTLDDGRRVLAARSWADQVFVADKPSQRFAQSFVAELWIEDGDAVTRVYAIWPEIAIGLGSGAMQKLIGDSLDEGFQNADTYASGGACKNDRDATFER